MGKRKRSSTFRPGAGGTRFGVDPGGRPGGDVGTRSGGAAGEGSLLYDRLDPATLERLQAKATELKQEEAARKEAEARLAAERRKAEQKRREHDFAYLLEHSKLDWRQFK